MNTLQAVLLVAMEILEVIHRQKEMLAELVTIIAAEAAVALEQLAAQLLLLRLAVVMEGQEVILQ